MAPSLASLTRPRPPAWLLAWAGLVATIPARAADEQPGQDMVATAARALLEYPLVEARVRQRVRLYGQEMSGHGLFQQARFGNQLRVRYELRLPIGNQVTHWQQVNDGDYLWIRRDVLDQQQLSVVDLRRVRAALATNSASANSALATGGLPQLLDALHHHFAFGPARSAMLGKEPVWILDGCWQPPGRAGQGDKTASPATALLPCEHQPTEVQVVLSRAESLPLFPFRVEYYHTASAASGQSQRRATVCVEFFEVRTQGTPDPRYFNFSPGNQKIEDETEQFLKAVRGSAEG